MTLEIWKPVHGYVGFYEVSNHGKVRGVDREVNLPDGRIRRIKEKLLSIKHNNDGYCFVSLSRDNVTKTCYIHRLVAMAFIQNPDGLTEVNHLDGDKENNIPANLAWCSHQDNVIHAYANQLTSNMGGSHYLASGVIDRTLGRTFETVRDWADARGINYSTARNVLKGQKSRLISLQGISKITKTHD